MKAGFFEVDITPRVGVGLRDDWRPAKPELTDTKCLVLKFIAKTDGHISGCQ